MVIDKNLTERKRTFSLSNSYTGTYSSSYYSLIAKELYLPEREGDAETRGKTAYRM